MKLIITTTFLLLLQFTKGQNGKMDLGSLSIGEKMPEVKIRNVINYPATEFNMSACSGKLVILDFWDKWCSACISAFPEMERLQRQFGEKIQVLLVTSNSLPELKALFQSSYIMKHLSLPVVTSDSLLTKLFPHAAVPHHVWIGSSGNVLAITSNRNTTATNIQAYLDGKKINLPVKKDNLSPETNPDIIDIAYQNGYNQLQYYSLITKEIEGFNSTAGWQLLMDTISKKQIGIKARNLSIVGLYQLAYNWPLYDINSIVVDASNPADYFHAKNDSIADDWNSKHLFNYELKFPPELSTRPRDMMRQDLDRFFSVHSSIEDRKKICWIITSSGNTDQLKTDRTGTMIDESNDSLVSIHNAAFVYLIMDLKAINFSVSNNRPFIIDETGYKDNIDINIAGDLSNLSTLQQELGRYGLIIRQEERIIPVLVLKAY